ncbi:MAG TPA: ABC transporter permease [Mycobacteriales bacterium]|nr:ABC transporter permease [Mycobacteriales bacterium]
MPIQSYLQFLLLGVGAGAIYAAIALGLLLTYRSSGVVNFAHGAAAMYGAYVFAGLSVSGDLLLPLPGAGGRVHLHVLSTPAAAAVAIAATTALELLLYALVFRPLRAAPPLSRLVASVGVMIALQAVVTLQYGADAISVPRVLPSSPVTVLGARIPSDRLWLAGLVVLVTVLLSLVYRRTRFGLASRAAAESETALALAGWSPDRVAAANWVLAGVHAGAAGVVIGPITTADPVTFTLLVVPALAAVLVAGFSSFAVTTAAALGLGMVQSVLVDMQTHASWLPATGIGKALPLLLIVVAAVARGSLVPARGERLELRTPVVAGPPPRPWLLTALAAVAGVALLVLLHGDYRVALLDSLVGVVVCLSIVVVTGYLGQLSLAQMAFAGVAGFALSRLQHSLGVPFPLDALAAAVLAALVGLAIGIPALRVRGPSLAVATLAGALAVGALLFQSPALTGGFAGSRVRPPSIGGLSLAPGAGRAGYPRLGFGLLVLVVTLAAGVTVAKVRGSALGRRFLAVRTNERAAEALGISVVSTKLVGFTLSAFLAGLAGALIGWQQGQLSFGSFDIVVSLVAVAVAYVGGIGRVSGAVVAGALVTGGLAFTALDSAAGLGRYQLFASGVAVVVAIVVAPDGITGAVRRGVRELRGLRGLRPTRSARR